MNPIFKEYFFDKDMNPINKLTNFEKVLEFNKLFGVKNETKVQTNIFENEKLVNYRMSLITEEYNELLEAVKEKDLTETIDALSDILFVVYGMYTALGINADDAYDIVYKSNMSKVCDTEEDAKESVKRYLEEIPQRYDSPAYKLTPDSKKFLVYNKSTNKILKNYKYFPADFNKLLENDTLRVPA